MANLKAFLKVTRFLLVTGFYYSVILLGHVFSIFGVNQITWAASARCKWGKAVINILNINLTVKGSPPTPPFFLVANHLSYVDVWVLFATAQGTFVAKSDLRDWPVAGFVLGTSGLIFVDRGRKADVKRVNDEISTNLTSEQGIFLFPEGTTSSGFEVLPFKSSLFQFPASKSVEVSSASITYSTPDNEMVAYQHIAWWDDTPFLTHFWNLLKLNHFDATITFSDEKISHSDRKYLAQTSFQLVREQFEPVKHPENYAYEHPGS